MRLSMDLTHLHRRKQKLGREGKEQVKNKRKNIQGLAKAGEEGEYEEQGEEEEEAAEVAKQALKDERVRGGPIIALLRRIHNYHLSRSSNKHKKIKKSDINSNLSKHKEASHKSVRRNDCDKMNLSEYVLGCHMPHILAWRDIVDPAPQVRLKHS